MLSYPRVVCIHRTGQSAENAGRSIPLLLRISRSVTVIVLITDLFCYHSVCIRYVLTDIALFCGVVLITEVYVSILDEELAPLSVSACICVFSGMSHS
jgi:hypothetical protein